MKAYQYQWLYFDHEDSHHKVIESMINKLGVIGWRLIHIEIDNKTQTTFVILERECP